MCNAEKNGYLVSFEALNAALELISIPEYKCQIGISYKDTYQNFINTTDYLSFLNVFHICDVYLGNIEFSEFKIF